MRLGTVTQQPNERKSYSFVYNDALDYGDEIESVISCETVPGDMDVPPILATNQRVRIFCSGGTDGSIYKLTVRVQTSGGEILEDELIIRIKEV